MSFRRVLMLVELAVAPDADDCAVACVVEDAITTVGAVAVAGVRSVSVGMPLMHLPRAVAL